MKTLKTVCVFCGTGFGKNLDYVTATKKLAQSMIKRNIDLVFGGGNDGLMKVVADEFIKSGRTVIGVIPQEYVNHGVGYLDTTKTILTHGMAGRINTMIDLSDGFVVLPGGLGTFGELFHILYTIRLGEMAKPCAVLNIDSFYDYLVKFLDQCVDNEFLTQAQRDILFNSDNPEYILDYFMDYEPVFLPKRWV